MKFQNADIFHFTWQLFGFSKLILKWNFKGKKVLTVHDPLSHSGNDSLVEENNRIAIRNFIVEILIKNVTDTNTFANNSFFINKIGTRATQR